MVSKINNGFIYVTNYSYKFRQLVQSLAERAEKLLPSGKMQGMAVFLFGSPARQEMIDESDADIMILRKSDNEDYFKFRSEFIKLLENENFSKIDVPEWGNFQDCEDYISKSVTEGNQIVEGKFIYGDIGVNSAIEQLKDKYCNIERFENVFCFQKLYFDQYYVQRTRKGVKNVKYGHGGTRDFMFVTWFVNILDSLDNRKINLEDNFPLVYKSLSSLYERRLVQFNDYVKYLESINIVLILRNEILIQNKWTADEGLTYLDDKAISTLFKRKIFNDEKMVDFESLKLFLNTHIENVHELKDIIWSSFIHYLTVNKGNKWSNKFNQFIAGKITEDDVNEISEEDDLLKMALVWNIHMQTNPVLFQKVFSKYKESKRWVLLASLCCHPECPEEILDYIAKNTACEKGYEYLLRIISRNKNTRRETLGNILENAVLEPRYRLVAKAAYDGGAEKANELR